MRPPFIAAALLLCPLLLRAESPPPQSIAIETGKPASEGITLTGPDACRQLLVTGRYADGRLRDLTQAAAFSVEPRDVAAVDASGLVTPLKEGRATIHAAAGSLRAELSVSVAGLAQPAPVRFSEQVVPLFTRYGCNSGACHGKASGQNGFKLSLLGFEPAEDFEYVVKEARGRRLFPAAPEHSLLLLKATGSMAHGGGRRIARDASHHRLLARWIGQGAPADPAGTPAVVRLEVVPSSRLLDRAGQQQLAVLAHRSDGSSIDVTRWSKFESGNAELAEVSETGLVTTKSLPGIVAVLARYQTHVVAFQAAVPIGAAVDPLPAPQNFIDAAVFKKLKELGLPPSPPCDDSTFIRRVTIDIAGRLPTRDETLQFLGDRAADRHVKLVDRLLASDDYAYYFAGKWSAVLRNRRKSDKDDPKPTFAFHEWIRDSLKQNKPFDEFVRAVVTASGEEVKTPPAVWYREVREPSAQLEDVSQLFLGQRIQCARCHHHPFEKWSQEDYYRMAAFFSRVGIKEPPPPKKGKKKNEPAQPQEPFSVFHKAGVAGAVNPRSGKTVAPAGLGAAPMDIPADDDPRRQLAGWMTAPDNPYFARTLVNRYWKHFLGRGLVDPEDDLRTTNPPTNPELLDALAKHFVEHKYDLKDLVRTICTSQVYRLSSIPNQHNAEDRQNYSRFTPRRLNAEVLLDAIDEVTGSQSVFKGVPAGTKAVQLPDNQFESYFLSVFGRPDSASACECERTSDSNLAQCLHLFNSDELLEKVSGRKPPKAADTNKDRGKGDAKKKGNAPKEPARASGPSGGRLRALLSDSRPPAERLRDLYLVALSREPSREETATLLAHIEKKKNAAEAYEDILWALLNTKEFLFNH